jgi:hypothetical protein
VGTTNLTRDDVQQGFQPQQEGDMQGVIKLAKYVSWPEEDNMMTTTIIIAPQSDETFKTAENLAATSKILSHGISVVRITDCNDDALYNANIIFIESGANIDIEKLIPKVADKQILTITNDIKMLEKGCMFYVKYDHDTGHTSYYYNKEAILASPLSISSHILMPDHKYEKQ